MNASLFSTVVWEMEPRSLAQLNRQMAAEKPGVTGGTHAVPGEGPLHPQFITVHSSALLRAPDDAARRKGFAAFVADLKAAKKQAETQRRAA